MGGSNLPEAIPSSYSYPEVISPAPPQAQSYTYADDKKDPNMSIEPIPSPPPPLPGTQTSSGKLFQNSIRQTSQSLNPSGVHALDVPHGYDPEAQRQTAHHQTSNLQYQRPTFPVGVTAADRLPSYDHVTNNATATHTERTRTEIVYVVEKPSKWRRTYESCRSTGGAIWFCFASLVAIALAIVILAGCSSKHTTLFATHAIDLKPTDSWSTRSTSSSSSSSSANRLPKTLLRAVNPMNGKLEEPNYLLFGFSGYCAVFKSNTSSSSAKVCDHKFVQPIFMPPLDPKANATDFNFNDRGILDLDHVNLLRRIVAAFLFIVIFYNTLMFIGVVLHYWEDYIFNFWWINLILGVIIGALFYFSTWSFYDTLRGWTLNDSTATGIFGANVYIGFIVFSGFLFFLIAANPIVMVIFVCCGVLGFFLGLWMIWCLLATWLSVS